MDNSFREIVAQVIDVRNLYSLNKKNLFYSLVGFQSLTDNDQFSHRPYFTKSELWGTPRCIFYKVPSDKDKLRIEIWCKEKIGTAIINLENKEKDGIEKKGWYPLSPSGEIFVSLKWNTFSTKVKGRKELLNGVFGANHDLQGINTTIARHERPYWKEYLERAEKMVNEGVELPTKTIIDILKGSLESTQKKNRVRVFVSSTFTDTETERNRLMADVYPFLSLLCKKIGLEFETVDMRWGVREFTNDNHQTSELCMKELHKCLNLSVGPAFLCLLGNKYGYRPFPAKITHEILNKIWTRLLEEEIIRKPELKSVESKLKGCKVENVLENLNEKEKGMIGELSDMLFIPTWFRLDANSNPPVFDLQNITTLLPNFRSTNSAERNAASSKWWGIFESMQLLLRKGAAALPKEEEEKYIISVTNEEVFHGILDNKNFKSQSILLARRVNDGETVKEDRDLKKYIDGSLSLPSPVTTLNGTPSSLSLDCEATSLLSHLKNKVSDLIDQENLLDYVVDKKHLGEEKEGGEEEKKKNAEIQELYLREVCEVVCKSLGDHILVGFKQNNIIAPPIFAEVVQHHSFLKLKLRGYVERENLQNKILEYCNAPDRDRSKEWRESRAWDDIGLKHFRTDDNTLKLHALVVYAESGAGKTALMAHVANKIHEQNSSSIVITRFLGTTPGSSDVLLLVRGICYQLMVILDVVTPENEEITRDGTPDDVNTLLHRLLEMAEGKERIFLFIDSIDQLLPNNNAYMLEWLPVSLPRNVRVVVSVLVPSKEEENNIELAKARPPNLYEYLRIIYDPFPDKNEFFLNIPQLIPSEAEQIVDSRLKQPNMYGWGRVLTPYQKNVVLKSSGTSFTPLYLNIALDLAIQWKSYTPESECTLAGSTREIILQLFRKLEAVHGKVLVSHALGYLTASRYGLSSQDMEDILSCDDEVLNDVYQWWVPPVRRLPPLLWKRLKEDLAGYLVDKGLGAVTLSSWFHRQFKEAAEDYYLSGDVFLARYKTLAMYFDGTLGEKGRLIQPQPLQFSAQQLNTHKISSLPYSQAFCLDPSLFQSSLYNLEFIEVKIRAGMAADLISDYDFAVNLLQKDAYTRTTFLEHINKLKAIQDFIKSNLNVLTRNPSLILMVALNQPDNSTLYSIATEQRGKSLYAGREMLLFIKKDAPLTGVMTVEGPEPCDRAHFERNEERLVTFHHTCIKVWEVATGLELQSIKKELTGGSNSLPGERAIFQMGQKCKIFDCANGVELLTLDTMGFARSFIGSSDKVMILKDVNGHGGVEIWDFVTGKYLYSLPSQKAVTHGYFSKDGTKVYASYSGAQQITIHDAKNGELIRTLEIENEVRFSTFSTNSKYFVTTGFDGSFTSWDLQTGEKSTVPKSQAHNKTIHHISTNPVANMMATASDDMTIKIWDASALEVKELFHLKGHKFYVSKTSFSSDGKILSSIADCVVFLWDVATGQQITSLTGHSARVNYCLFSADGKKALTCSLDRTARIWDLSARTQVIRSDNHDREVIGCEITPDGKFVVTSSDDQTLKIWDNKGTLIHTILQDKNWDPNFFISPSGDFLATVSKKTVIIINIQSGEPITVLQAHARDLYNACLFSSTGLMATHSNKEAKLWDTKTWKELKKFAGHQDPIHKIAFSPDGTQFITVSLDTFAVWNVKTGKKIHDLAGPDNELKYVNYTTDSKYVIGSIGTEIEQWSLSPEPEVSSSRTYPAFVQFGMSPADSTLCVGSFGTDNSFVSIGLDDLEIRGEALHFYKALPRFIFYKNEIWSWAYNEIVSYIVENGEVKKKNQFFIPRLVTCLARSGNLLVTGSPEGSVSFFVIE